MAAEGKALRQPARGSWRFACSQGAAWEWRKEGEIKAHLQTQAAAAEMLGSDVLEANMGAPAMKASQEPPGFC